MRAARLFAGALLAAALTAPLSRLVGGKHFVVNPAENGTDASSSASASGAESATS